MIAPHPKYRRLYRIIFESDTRAGWLFDVVLIGLILLSVVLVSLESVSSIAFRYETHLHVAEWVITILFTIEYLLRLLCVARRSEYALSFFGIVDLLSVIPTYLSLYFAGSQFLMVVRVLRLLRVFRVMKLARYVGAAEVLISALRASRAKIIVFLFTVLTSVVLVGAIMYIVEGPEHGFDSIPKSVYWSIVTITTVGFGDITPQTPFGQFLASLLMILGYGIIAVPTGIVTVELSGAMSKQRGLTCGSCARSAHDADAVYCKYCGSLLPPRA